jgi:hypothetical protein
VTRRGFQVAPCGLCDQPYGLGDRVRVAGGRPVLACGPGGGSGPGLAILALACPLYAMDLTVLHLAVPAISADPPPSSTHLLRITDIYGFVNRHGAMQQPSPHGTPRRSGGSRPSAAMAD